MDGRLLRTAGSAEWNMATDEALLESAGDAPTLRLYQWLSPAVTLGRFQNARESLDLDRCRELALPVVRRPTGGRSVYHHTDLTYSLVFPMELVGGLSVCKSYKQISAAFIEALREQRIALKPGERAAPGRESPADCFALSAASDHSLNGRKVIGSAQLRRGSSVLQQGSLRLWPMAVPEDVIRGAQISLPDAGVGADPASVGAALATALAALWGLQWREGELTALERNRADLLLQERYSRADWNLDGV